MKLSWRDWQKQKLEIFFPTLQQGRTKKQAHWEREKIIKNYNLFQRSNVNYNYRAQQSESEKCELGEKQNYTHKKHVRAVLFLLFFLKGLDLSYDTVFLFLSYSFMASLSISICFERSQCMANWQVPYNKFSYTSRNESNKKFYFFFSLLLLLWIEEANNRCRKKRPNCFHSPHGHRWFKWPSTHRCKR